MGKYIKKFDTHSDYEDFIETEDFIRPNVSYCVDNKDVHYNSIQTLFAIEFEAGKFAFGHADEDELFVATEDGFAHIWYADGNGNVTGYVVNGGDIASNIIDAYNEHFGTDISIWTPEKNTLQVGDTVPNWNAYEKIEMVKNVVKIKYGENFIPVKKKESEFEIYTGDFQLSGMVIMLSPENIVASSSLSVKTFVNQYLNVLNNYFNVSFTTIAEKTTRILIGDNLQIVLEDTGITQSEYESADVI